MAESKTVLVTGSSGFVGANLARRLLKQGHEVHCILREESNTWRIKDVLSQINVHRADLRNRSTVKEAVERANPKIVYHLAVYGGYSFQRDWQKIMESNVNGISNLLQAARETGVERFVNTGSSSEYGIKDKPMQETDLLEPVNLYGVSKAFATILCRQLWLSEKMPTVTLRLLSPYGYFEEKSRLVPYVIERCLAGKAIELSSPESVRDFVFIEDVLDAYTLAAESDKAIGEAINIGTGKQHTVKEAVDTVIGICRADSKPLWGKRAATQKEEPKNWVADISKAERLLGWKPRHSLKEGLQKTVDWHRTQNEGGASLG